MPFLSTADKLCLIMFPSTSRFARFAIIICCLSNFGRVVGREEFYIPITYTIKQRQTECIYDKLQKGDSVTYSVFVVEALNNGPPKASLKFEGPVAGNEDVLAKIDGDSSSVANDSKSKVGQELYTGVQRIWPKVKDIDQQVR